MRKLLTLALISTFLSAPLWGQIRLFPRENKWEVSFFSGLSSLGGDSFVTPLQDGGTQMVFLDYDAGLVLGARITENLGQHFGAEFEYAYADHDLFFAGLSPSAPSLNLDQKVHKFSYSGLYYLKDRNQRVRPYASGGIGASFYELSSQSEGEALQAGVTVKDRWKLAFSWGAGIKVHAGRRWGLRLDFRDHVTGVPNYGLPEQAPLIAPGQTGPGFRPDGLLHNWQLTGGIMYTFGAN